MRESTTSTVNMSLYRMVSSAEIGRPG